MPSSSSQTPSGSGDASQRKDAHLALAADPLAMARVPSGFDMVRLMHCALPECNLDEVDISTSCLGRMVSAPFFIGSMTGGTAHATAINLALAEAAETTGIGLAVGSQRAGLGLSSPATLRQAAPSILCLAILVAFSLPPPVGWILLRAVDDLQADALFIHVNPLQSCATRG